MHKLILSLMSGQLWEAVPLSGRPTEWTEDKKWWEHSSDHWNKCSKGKTSEWKWYVPELHLFNWLVVSNTFLFSNSFLNVFEFLNQVSFLVSLRRKKQYSVRCQGLSLPLLSRLRNLRDRLKKKWRFVALLHSTAAIVHLSSIGNNWLIWTWKVS